MARLINGLRPRRAIRATAAPPRRADSDLAHNRSHTQRGRVIDIEDHGTKAELELEDGERPWLRRRNAKDAGDEPRHFWTVDRCEVTRRQPMPVDLAAVEEALAAGFLEG